MQRLTDKTRKTMRLMSPEGLINGSFGIYAVYVIFQVFSYLIGLSVLGGGLLYLWSMLTGC